MIRKYHFNEPNPEIYLYQTDLMKVPHIDLMLLYSYVDHL